MTPKKTIIDEETRFNLRFDNIWAIIVCVAMIVGSYALMDKRLAMIEQNQQEVIENQKLLSQDFREWKTQAEKRIGTVESNQNQVISYLEGHLQVKIVR